MSMSSTSQNLKKWTKKKFIISSYKALQSSLQIQRSALLDNGTSLAGQFKYGGIRLFVS